MIILIVVLVFVLSSLINFRRSARSSLSCGIAGFSGHRAVDETKMRFLITENQIRGTDSTGVYGNHLYKDNVVAKTFIQAPGFKAAIKGSKIVGAHTRAASVGSRTAANSHPFAFGLKEEWECVGAHNGFVLPELINYHHENLGFKKDEFDVDSMLIFAAISKAKDINIISKIEGAMSIWFVLPNKDKEVLYLYKRGYTRNLHIGQSNEGLYFSSDSEPLALIGCENIYCSAPNTLYAIKQGEIVEQYIIPDPTVKSLPANVSRANWRAGIPTAQLNALPVDVYSPKDNTASSSYPKTSGSMYDKYSSYNKYESDDPYKDYYDRLKENKGKQLSISITSKKDKKYVAQFAKVDTDWTDKLEAQYSMLIKNVRDEIEGLELEPVNYYLSRSYSSESLNSAVLLITLTNNETNDPLIAWSVLGKNHDVHSISGMNGLAILQIPEKDCGTLQEYTVYDPIDSFGPYKFSIQPEKGRVSEVTLKISFRGKDEKSEKTTDNQAETSKGKLNDGGGDVPVVDSTGPSVGWYLDSLTEEDIKLLLGQTGPLLKTYTERDSNGHQVKRPISQRVVPLKDGADAGIKYGCMLPSMTPTQRDATIDFVLETDGHGRYVNFDSHVKKYIMDHVDREPETEVYTKLYSDYCKRHEINYPTLIRDAVRLMCWDRSQTRAWYKLGIYIHMLMLEQGNTYVPTYKNKAQYMPAALLKRRQADTYQTGSKKNSLVRSVPYIDYVDLLTWAFDKTYLNLLDVERLDKFKNGLGALEDLLSLHISKINGALTINNEGPIDEMALIELKSATIAARDYLKSELFDVQLLRDDVIKRIMAARVAVK